MDFQHGQGEILLSAIVDAVVHSFIIPFLLSISEDPQVFQKCADNEVYNMCETRDMLVLLIMLHTGADIQYAPRERVHHGQF